MFVFGHLGIGYKLASPWSRRLSKRLILLGTVLPDLIDKPVYYGLSWWTGKSGAALGLIDRARQVGMSSDGLARMQKTTRAMTVRWFGRMVAAGAIAALVAALLVAGLRRAGANRRRLAI